MLQLLGSIQINWTKFSSHFVNTGKTRYTNLVLQLEKLNHVRNGAISYCTTPGPKLSSSGRRVQVFHTAHSPLQCSLEQTTPEGGVRPPPCTTIAQHQGRIYPHLQGWSKFSILPTLFCSLGQTTLGGVRPAPLFHNTRGESVLICNTD